MARLWPFSRKAEQQAATSGTSKDRVESWLSTVFGGGADVRAGVNVNHESALRIIAVYACVRVLSQGVASLPLKLYRRTADGKEEATNHPLFKLFKQAPNSWQTPFEYLEQQQGAVALRGNAYSLIEYDKRFNVGELIPLNPDTIQVAEARNGELFYESSDLNKTLPARLIMHNRGFSMDGKLGISPIGLAREGLGLAMAAESHGATLFGNGASPKGALIAPKPLTEEQAADLRKSWKSVHSGIDNSNNVAILHGGLDYKQVGLSPEDAQFLETRRFQIGEIARLFGVPAHMINDLERATFSNIEHQSLSFVIHTLRPWLVRWEQRLNRDLLNDSGRGKYFFEFTVDGLLRGDIGSRYSAYATGRQWGWLSQNDVRAMENLNPIPGGDTYETPLNMTDKAKAEDTGAGNEPQGKPANDQTDEPTASDN